MTERIVRPVRAWADYDECCWYIDWDDLWLTWSVWNMPLTGKGGPYEQTGYSSIPVAISDTDDRHSPVRSLRVLYENGYELTLGYDREFSLWDWFLSHPDTGQCAKGDFAEDADSEAVQRAMIAAAAWFSQRQDGV